MNPTYVCAFRGRRDSYQVPLALAEGGLLDRFITDAYGTPGFRAFARRVSGRAIDVIADRHEAGIPDDRIDCLWAIAMREQLRHAIGMAHGMTFLRYDRHYSLAAARRAEASGASLLLYSPYAWEAFTSRYRHQPQRVLFQYHPHPDAEQRVLAEDRRRHPATAAGVELDARPPIEALVRRERDCWQHADRIICSSGFTRQSLLDAGCPPERCAIIPYGVDLPAAEPGTGPDRFRVLFVGTGSRRKGLAHLLHAWAHAALPQDSELVIVSRVFDPGLEAMALSTRQVSVIRGVSAAKLRDLYASSTLFVMPSLVEGFGMVYLEALSHGCPVLGTPHSGLPELGTEADGIFITPAGNRPALIAMLERLSAEATAAAPLRRAARATAARHPWSAFRRQIRSTVTGGADA